MSATDREKTRATALGQTEWGTFGSAAEHRRYAQPIPPRSRRRCSCCRTRATHVGMANGVALMSGCHLAVQRWVRGPHALSPIERWYAQ